MNDLRLVYGAKKRDFGKAIAADLNEGQTLKVAVSSPDDDIWVIIVP